MPPLIFLPTPNPDRGGRVGYIFPLIFLYGIAQNTNFINRKNRKPGNFFDKKRLITLYVNPFIQEFSRS